METKKAILSEAKLHSHSLGILIEWKLLPRKLLLLLRNHSHSLGILIEWKRDRNSTTSKSISIPTRWGY